jgi:hypothetical protein
MTTRVLAVQKSASGGPRAPGGIRRGRVAERILVAYTGGDRAGRLIAERVAVRLRQLAVTAHAVPLEELGGVRECAAALEAWPSRTGSPPADRFILRNARLLSRVPVWLVDGTRRDGVVGGA